MKKRIWRWLLPTLLALCFLFTGWVIWDNNRFVITEYTVENEKLPESFSGFRIAQVSDFHNCQFGEDHEDLLQALEVGKPDIIAITGDLVDSYHPDLENSMDFVEGATKIAPVYYVSGNHESRQDYAQICLRLEQLGVTILEERSATLRRGTDAIVLLGVQDPAFYADPKRDEDEQVMQELIAEIEFPKEFSILLSHRNNMLDIYADVGADLVLSGHAHGGALQFPWGGGFYANGKLFPEYTNGIYKQDETTMIVSRGIGNSLLPLRINNTPELVFVTFTNR